MSEVLKFRDILRWLLWQSGGASFERFDGSIAPVSLDEPASITRNITNDEIIIDGGLASWDYSFTNTSRLITRIDLYYKPNLALDGGWAKKFCQYTGGTGEDHNFTTIDDDGHGGSYYSGLLADSYDYIDEERGYTLYANGIRDGDTAEKLAMLLIKWRVAPLVEIVMDCTYSVLDIELFDKVGITGDIITNFSFLSGCTWLVTGHRITLPIHGKQPGVQLKLLQMGPASPPIPSDEDWIDTYATGDEKVDTFATGEFIQEVF